MIEVWKRDMEYRIYDSSATSETRLLYRDNCFWVCHETKQTLLDQGFILVCQEYPVTEESKSPPLSKEEQAEYLRLLEEGED